MAQAAALEERHHVDRVVSISMREDALVRKLLGRRVCPKCNRSYNVAHIDEPGFYMPAILPENPNCACYNRLDLLIRREVLADAQRTFMTRVAALVRLICYQLHSPAVPARRTTTKELSKSGFACTTLNRSPSCNTTGRSSQRGL